MSYFEVSDLDWELFEKKFNITKTEVIEIKNIFRHICRLYVLKNYLQILNDSENKKDIEIILY